MPGNVTQLSKSALSLWSVCWRYRYVATHSRIMLPAETSMRTLKSTVEDPVVRIAGHMPTYQDVFCAFGSVYGVPGEFVAGSLKMDFFGLGTAGSAPFSFNSSAIARKRCASSLLSIFS